MSTLSSFDNTDFMGLPPDSPGSSVSTQLQEEYDELLKYAVIIPHYNEQTRPKIISGHQPGGSLPLFQALASQQTAGSSFHDSIGSGFLQQQHADCGDDLRDSIGEQNDDTVTESEVEEVRNGSDVESLHSESQHLHQSTPRDLTPVIQYKSQSRVEKTIEETVTHKMFDQQQQQHHQPHHHYRPHSPTESVASSRFSEDISLAYTGGVDPDVARMEHMLDQWTLDLKRNVLAEFGQSKIRILEQHKQQMIKERERHTTEKTQLQNEIESMKELLHRYENSVERKDQVISNLTKGLQKHKEKNELMRAFCEWKISHNDAKKESFASKLAQKHYHHHLQRKCWDAWHSLIENKWRNRVEKACQSKAQEICMGLTNEYETQISTLNSALDAAKNEVSQLRQERERYEETMKKAFMRGVCALNMEAMSMFHDPDVKETMPQPRYASSGSGAPQADGAYSDIDHMSTHSHIVPQEPIFNSEPPGAPLPRVVSVSHGPVKSTTVQSIVTQGKSITTGTTRRGKNISAKVTSRIDTGRSKGGPSTLAPPMSSVVVERHQPVTKQTVGHATANQYPVNSSQTVVVQRKISGQSEKPYPPANIHKVKVVE